MWFADFETTTLAIDKNKSWVWLWGIKKNLKDKMVYGCDLKGFLDHLVDKHKTEVLFHNLGWDFNYIYKYLLDECGYEFIDTTDNIDYALGDKEFTWLCTEAGRIITATIRWKGITIEFKDSWLVLMASVEDLGNTIGKIKLQDSFDYDHYHDKVEDLCVEDIEYLERDIDIVIETFTKSTSVVKKKLTRAGMAYEDFRKFYGEREFANDFGGKVWNYNKRGFDYFNVLNEEEWDLCHRSYQGGYTNWNPIITNMKVNVPNGVSYDVNSLYPAVMEANKYPYGKMYYSKPIGCESVCLLVVLIKKATIKDPTYPPLIKEKSNKLDAKYLKELEYEERVMWEEEFEFIKQYYHMDYSIVSKRYFKTKYVFDDWLAKLKQLKIEATDATIRNFWKGIYNSLYGKFGQNKTMGARVIVEDGFVAVTINGERYLMKKGEKTVTEIKGKLYHKSDGSILKKYNRQIRYGKQKQYKHVAKYVSTDQLKYMPIASYTTWLARKTLWEAMFKNLDKWLYSDTDSCYFSDQPVGLDIHESRFGAWKAEHKFTKFKVLRAKCYMYASTHEWKKGGWVDQPELVRKISGVSKEGKKKINWENFHLGSIIINGKRGTKNVEGGKFVVDGNYKLGKFISMNTEEEEKWYQEKMKEFHKKLKGV